MIEFQTEEDRQKVAIFDELCRTVNVSPELLLLVSPDPYYGAAELRSRVLRTSAAKEGERDED